MAPVDTLEVAAVQMSSQGDLKKNLETAKEMVLEASRRGAHLVVLPENLAYMGPEEGKRAIAESMEKDTGPIVEALSSAAREANVCVVGGGVPEKSEDADRPYNACVVFSPDGSLVAKYRKIHLFDVDLPDGTHILESAASKGGTEAVVVEIDSFQVGLTICYDLRFPELFRKLVDMGAEVVLVPSAFTVTTGKDHWHVLARARAIENQIYLAAPAQFGSHPKGRTTYGKSIIVDPWGQVIAQCSDGEGICYASLHRSYLEKVRKGLPCLQHRRIGV